MTKAPQFFIVTILIIFALVLSGCSSFISSMYGIKKIKAVDEKQIQYYSKKFHIPFPDVYELDTSFITFLNSIDTTSNKEQRNNHSQPLQVLYYDQNGKLISYLVNCYAGGFPNLKWNRNDSITFPPYSLATTDTLLPLNTHLTFLRSLKLTKLSTTMESDYCVIVYWNRFMGRQSKRLIRFVNDNCKIQEEMRIKIIYLNNDNFFVSQN